MADTLSVGGQRHRNRPGACGGQVRQLHGEGFIRLNGDVAGSIHGNRAGLAARRNGQRAGGREVVAARERRPVEGGVVHTHRPIQRVIQAHREDKRGGGTNRALRVRHIGHRHGRAVVVGDRADTLSVGWQRHRNRPGACGGQVRQLHGEGFIRLNGDVAGSIHGNRAGLAARRNGQRAGGREVVAARERRPVEGGVVHTHRPIQRVIQAHREDKRGGGTNRALRVRHIGHRHGRAVVVGDRADTLDVGWQRHRNRPGACGGQVRQLHGEGFIWLNNTIAGSIHGNRAAQVARRNGQRAGGREVVTGRERRPVEGGIVHTHRPIQRGAQADREDKRGSGTGNALRVRHIGDRHSRAIVVGDRADTLDVGWQRHRNRPGA